MRMRQVEAFRAVILSGGVTAAAEMLNVSQPSVSRLVGDLERDVGFALFERRNGRMFPTAQADALYDAVRRSFTGMEQLDQAARRIRAQPIGAIRIAALPALASSVLPPVIAQFCADHSEIKVTVEAVGQREVLDRVFLGQADLGLAVEGTVRAGVASHHLAEAEYVCVLPLGHRLSQRKSITASDLEDELFIGPLHMADALWYGIDDALKQAGVAPKRRLETQQSFSAYAFVDAGLGVTIAEPFSAPLFSRLGVQIRPFRPKLTVNFAVLEPEAGPRPPLIAKFRAAVFTAAAECLDRAASLAQLRASPV